MGHGLYLVKRSSIHPYIKFGDYGVKRNYSNRLRKGQLLMWVERDEMNENWFMITSTSEIISIRGSDLDGVSPI